MKCLYCAKLIYMQEYHFKRFLEAEVMQHSIENCGLYFLRLRRCQFEVSTIVEKKASRF